MNDRKELRKERKRQRRLTRDEVIRTLENWWEAWFSGNVATVAAMACERFVEFAGDGRPMVVGKDALMKQAGRRPGSVEVSGWEITKPEVKVLEDAAVCRYCFQVTGTLDRKRVSIGGLATDVLVKSGEGWKVVAHHGSFTTALRQPSVEFAERFTCVSLAGGEACEVTLGRQTHQRRAPRSRTPGTNHGQSQDQLNVIVTGRSDEPSQRLNYPAQGDQQNSEALGKPLHLKERENVSLFGTEGVIMPPRD